MQEKCRVKAKLKDNENVFCFLIQRQNILNEKHWRLCTKGLRNYSQCCFEKKKKLSMFPYFESVTLVQYTNGNNCIK